MYVAVGAKYVCILVKAVNTGQGPFCYFVRQYNHFRYFSGNTKHFWYLPGITNTVFILKGDTNIHVVIREYGRA
jgi:hypothetical protein